MTTKNVLVLGASYGALFGVKLALAGHRATLVCTGPTAALIRREGVRVRFPVKGRDAPVEVASRGLPGELTAATPDAVDPADFHLVVLAMQEAQYAAAGVRELMQRIAAARVPCLAIMNMPPLPFLARIPGLATAALEGAYTDPGVWEGFDAGLVSLASPDPQAFRPAGEPKNVLMVGLATNFKAGPFADSAHNALLRTLEADIEAARFTVDGTPIDIPVKLKVHDSNFVPLAKWPMLMTGNYRSIRADDMISIRDAVHGDLARSREIYAWVTRLCFDLGAKPEDLVPFEKYAKAAEGLGKPSSAARALFGGAEHIERVDALLWQIAEQRGTRCDALDEIVALVHARLAANRERAAAARAAEARTAALA